MKKISIKAVLARLAGVLLLVVIAVLAVNRPSGPDGYREGHAPGDTEQRGNLKILHLKDGAFVQEQLNGTNHYFLIEGPMSSFELTPTGLRMVLVEEQSGFMATSGRRATLSTPRQPTDWIVAFMDDTGRAEPRGATRMSATEIRLQTANNFTAETTVMDIYRAGR